METTAKKPYQTPHLIVHGKVEDITGPKQGAGPDAQQFPNLS